jgi:hypothetical protein
MSDKFILKRERLDDEYEATIYAWPVHGPDVPVEIEVEIVAMNSDYYDHCYAESIDHALEAVAAARNSGFNFDRFRAEQRIAAADERDELDLY